MTVCTIPRLGVHVAWNKAVTILTREFPLFRFPVIRISVYGFTTCANDCSCHWQGSIVSSEEQDSRDKELIRHGREEAKGYSRQGSET